MLADFVRSLPPLVAALTSGAHGWFVTESCEVPRDLRNSDLIIQFVDEAPGELNFQHANICSLLKPRISSTVFPRTAAPDPHF
jgi:hypothetical protein